MNPPFNAAMAASLGTEGRFDFAVTVAFGFADIGPISLNVGGRFDFPVA